MIKKIFGFFTLFYCIIFNLNAETLSNITNETNNSFYNGNILTISELKDKHDDTYVVLEGNIIKKINDEKFLFKDSTGKIEIEIDDDKNYLLKNINKNTLIQIYGEYEKHIFKMDEIEVKDLKIIKQN